MKKPDDIQPGIDPQTGFIIATGDSVGPRDSIDSRDEGPKALSDADIGALMARTRRPDPKQKDANTGSAVTRTPRPEGLF